MKRLRRALLRTDDPPHAGNLGIADLNYHINYSFYHYENMN